MLAITVGAGAEVDERWGRLRRPRTPPFIVGTIFMVVALVEEKRKETYVQTYTALAHAIDRATHGGRLPGILAHPQQPRRINHASSTRAY